MTKIQFGVSFSRKYCTTIGVEPRLVLQSLINVGFKRFRLMSYWDEIEKAQGEFDFSWLEQDISTIRAAGGEVTLSVGLRQPRYPECHPPTWYRRLNHEQKHQAIYSFLKETIKTFKNEPTITSWQLENEALNNGIGTCQDYCRNRLRKEFEIIKSVDARSVLMSTSNSYGLPLRAPRPDIVGLSLYRSQHNGKKYTTSKLPVIYYKFLRTAINLVLRKPVIIHELQCEPWGPKSTEQLSDVEQMKSMSPEIMQQTIDFAVKTGITTIDLWGGEWWYWRSSAHSDDRYLKLASRLLRKE